MDARRTLFKVILEDMGLSRESVELRLTLLDKLDECRRRGIDPFEEFAKFLQSLPSIDLPTLPAPKIPDLRINVPRLPPFPIPTMPPIPLFPPFDSAPCSMKLP